MTLAASMLDAIERLVNDLGTNVTLRRTSVASYDPSTSSASTSTDDDESLKVAFVNYQNREIDGDNIIRGDRKALFSSTKSDGTSLSKEPQPDDQFVGEADTARIVSVFKYKSGDTIIGYSCQVRA